MSVIAAPQRRTPWHLWVVGVLALLWNGSGAYVFMMAQSGRLAGVSAAEAGVTLRSRCGSPSQLTSPSLQRQLPLLPC